MKDVHLVVGVVALALFGAATLVGAWSWRRAEPSRVFWILLRTGQAVLVLEVALGGILLLLGKKVSGLHILYGLLPLLVSFLGEQLRFSAAEMVLHSRGFESAGEVGELPADEQRSLALAIVQREVGVMAIAAFVIVVLLVRAAGTAG